jgi:hypothetical protein
VIDPETGAIYLDAMVGGLAGIRHLIFGLSLKDGSVLPGWPVDVAEALKAKGESFISRDQNERGALTSSMAWSMCLLAVTLGIVATTTALSSAFQ